MNKKTENIEIYTDYITLGQFLKIADVISTGGEAKAFLQSNEVIINGELDTRRGRKLREGDLIDVLGRSFKIIQK